ncbi:hypothetical protein T439DRAFT_136008 [Meredithblackwellia eburnea MCA 4105]
MARILRLLLLVGVVRAAAQALAQPTHAPLLQRRAAAPANDDDHNQKHWLAQRQATSASSSSSRSTITSSASSIPATAAQGGLSYTKPAATDAVSYYKIASGNLVTFGWNFTSLYVQPSSLTFQAYCSANSYTYPVGPTTGIPGDSTSLVWDPYSYQQSAGAIPFAQASYTLRVFDERGWAAAASPGYFYGPASVVNFAMYSPAAYTPLASGWTCVACSYAPSLSVLSHPAVVAIPVTVALILIGGAGVFNR